jgi:hypothetical protein
VPAIPALDAPLCVVNGPADPVSGAHLFASLTHHLRASVAHTRLWGDGGEHAAVVAARVVAARSRDHYASLPPAIGHYPQLEDVAGVARELAVFYAQALP